MTTADKLHVLQGHEYDVLSVAFSPDGRPIVSGAKDDAVRIWDAETGALVQTLEIHVWVWGVCFSPDGKTLVTTSQTGYGDTNQTITLWQSAAPTDGQVVSISDVAARKRMCELREERSFYSGSENRRQPYLRSPLVSDRILPVNGSEFQLLRREYE